MKVKQILVINCTRDQSTKAASTDHNIPSIIVSTLAVFIRVESSFMLVPSLYNFTTHIPTAHHKRQNTIDTVVEVGSPNELNLLSKRISAIITAKKIVITSIKLKCSG